MKIKICGLSRPEDIDAVNGNRPDMVGFVFAPKSRRYVSPQTALELKNRLDQGIRAAGVFVDETLENIVDLVQKQVIDLVQLHGSESVAFMEELKYRCDVPVVKAVSMTGDRFSQELRMWDASRVDFLLLDSGAGGTGQQFDYGRITRVEKPFFLAGGLTPENVAEAALKVHPYGVDMSSGVETDGKKDRKKIEEAVRRIRNVERKIR